MQNQRLFAWALFGLLILMTWQQWQEDYAPRLPTESSADAVDTTQQPVVSPLDLPPDVPEVSQTEESTATPALATPDVADLATDNRQLLSVSTDVLNLQIDLAGGDIVSAKLPAYPVDKDSPDVPVALMSMDPREFAAFRLGLTTRNKQDEPNHQASFRSTANQYELQPGDDALRVPLTWTGAGGIEITKTFVLQRGSYAIDVVYEIQNKSDIAWDAAPYARIVHVAKAPERSLFDVESYSFDGPATFDGNEYEKHSLKDLGKSAYLVEGVQGGWVAAIEHHFLSAIVPPADATVRLDAARSGEQFVTGYVGQPIRVEPGAGSTVTLDLFVGPKLQDQLRDVSPRLPLTVDYGMLTLLSDPLFWLLSKVHSFVGNWGWAIIIVTLLIKLVFYKLTEQSGRSMAKMRKLQPRLKALQERYKDDRQKLSEAMMEMYKREKVNPAAGCLPILIQMPFFLAFYWVLLESVEMRQAPFMLWINDLSSRDPLFILPLLMGAAMLAQQQLNPAPADPVQAKVMRILPVVFCVMFAFFPAGLVLYWFTNTILGVAQQWQINRVVAAEGHSRD
ncbi:MAG: membrane protein insertase YidC [Pseudomonadota bacterium]